MRKGASNAYDRRSGGPASELVAGGLLFPSPSNHRRAGCAAALEVGRCFKFVLSRGATLAARLQARPFACLVATLINMAALRWWCGGVVSYAVSIEMLPLASPIEPNLSGLRPAVIFDPRCG